MKPTKRTEPSKLASRNVPGRITMRSNWGKQHVERQEQQREKREAAQRAALFAIWPVSPGLI
jgi:hypothetical protein